MNFKSQTIYSWILLSVLGIIWGSSFLATKIALISFQPLQVSSLRIIIGVLTLITYLLLLRKGTLYTAKNQNYWITCLGVALFSNAIPFTLLAIAQEHLSSVFVGLCMATIPLIILFLTHLLTIDEQISARKILGILLGVCGTALLILSKEGMLQNPLSSNNNIFAWLCILAPFCYGSGTIIIRKSQPISYLEFSTHSLLIASLICLPFLILLGEFPLDANYQSIIATLYLGIFSTGIATIILVSLIKTEGAIFVSLVNFKVPIWSTIFGIFILREVLPNNFTISFILILLGVLICQIKTKK
ncbi:MAG: DMT family transporter [Pseudomonadota bacterium]|nr:DMT family transporter [Pseudomonadota bacterium]